jgi:hypothetical protein
MFVLLVATYTASFGVVGFIAQNGGCYPNLNISVLNSCCR